MNTIFRTTSLAFTVGLAAVGCDLQQKDIGVEPNNGDVDPCEPGDQMPALDGCNTCACEEDGQWACTEIACGDSDSGVDPTGDPWTPLCEPGNEMPADDGCNTCFCDEDGQWACTEIACSDTDEPGDTDGGIDNPVPVMIECDASLGYPLNTLFEASIDGDLLSVSLGHSGGCSDDHAFVPCWDGTFLESDPEQVGIGVRHVTTDECEAFLERDVVFDLSPIREAYLGGNDGDGIILVNLLGLDGQLTYVF